MGELGQNRPLRAVCLPEFAGKNQMIKMLEGLTRNGFGTRVLAYTCRYDVYGYARGQLWAIGTAFPSLTYLGVSLPAQSPLFSEETYRMLSVRVRFRAVVRQG